MVRVTDGGGTQLSFADTGDAVPPVDADQALRIARAFEGGISNLHYDSRLIDADQWSFGVRGRMPMHRIAVDDAAGTMLYVTEIGGDVVLKTTASGRLWGGAGAVMHWLYFAPLRRNAALWNQVDRLDVDCGTLMCLVGLAWGLWRISPLRGYRLRRERQWSPYAGWMRWHHYAGLIFGVVTTTWIFSGLLSMDPWDWHPSTAPTRDQRIRVAGGPLDLNDLTIARVQRAVQAFRPSLEKELEVIRFRGRYYATGASGIVSFDEPQYGARDQLPADLVFGAADVAMNGVPIEGISWLDDYDAYYYDRGRRLSLPVLRVRYGDPQRTWLYFDPKPRRHRAQGRTVDAPQSVAVPRLPQPRFSVPVLPPPAMGRRGDPAEPGRDGVERHDVERRRGGGFVAPPPRCALRWTRPLLRRRDPERVVAGHVARRQDQEEVRLVAALRHLHRSPQLGDPFRALQIGGSSGHSRHRHRPGEDRQSSGARPSPTRTTLPTRPARLSAPSPSIRTGSS